MLGEDMKGDITVKTPGNKLTRQPVKGHDGHGQPAKLRQVGKLRLDQKRSQQGSMRIAPAYYIGRQKGIEGMQAFDLYNLTENIPGYVQGSTVSGRTLRAAGFELPPRTPDPDYERRVHEIRHLVRRILRLCGSRTTELL